MRFVARPLGSGSDERGYVLIWALFAFVILGGLATISLKTSGSERRLSKAASGWNQSFYAAEAGLEMAALEGYARELELDEAAF